MPSSGCTSQDVARLRRADLCSAYLENTQTQVQHKTEHNLNPLATDDVILCHGVAGLPAGDMISRHDFLYGQHAR